MYSEKSIKTQIDPKILSDIQVYKNKFKRKVSRKKELLQRSLSFQIFPKVNQTEFNQRQISLGYSKIQKPQQLFYDFDSVKTKHLKQQTQMIDLQDFQERDIMTINSVLKKYEKQISMLFYKYSNVGSIKNKKLIQEKIFLSFSDLNRLLKDKNLNKLPKIVINQIISFINKKNKYNINVLVGVQEQQFNQFLILFANLYLKEEKLDKDEPFGLKLQKILLKLFDGELFTREFNDKKAIEWFQQNQISKLKKQNIPLPNGYKKISVIQICEQPCIPFNEDPNIPESFHVCLIFLNQLLKENLGINIFPPLIKLQPITRIMPIFKAPKPQIPSIKTERILKKSLQTSSESINFSENQQKNPIKIKNHSHKINSIIESYVNLKIKSSGKAPYIDRSNSYKYIPKKISNKELYDSDLIVKQLIRKKSSTKKIYEELQNYKKQKQKNFEQKILIEKIEKLKIQKNKEKHLEENKKKLHQKREKDKKENQQKQMKQQQQIEIKRIQVKLKAKALLQKSEKQISNKRLKFNQKQKFKQRSLKKIKIIQRSSIDMKKKHESSI